MVFFLKIFYLFYSKNHYHRFPVPLSLKSMYNTAKAWISQKHFVHSYYVVFQSPHSLCAKTDSLKNNPYLLERLSKGIPAYNLCTSEDSQIKQMNLFQYIYSTLSFRTWQWHISQRRRSTQGQTYTFTTKVYAQTHCSISGNDTPW